MDNSQDALTEMTNFVNPGGSMEIIDKEGDNALVTPALIEQVPVDQPLSSQVGFNTTNLNTLQISFVSLREYYYKYVFIYNYFCSV